MFIAILISLLSNVGWSVDSIVWHCDPSQIRPWPANARVDVLDQGAGRYQLLASTEYYGVDLANGYNVDLKSLQLKIVYAGEAARLTILPDGRGQYWSKDDGPQDVICKH